MKTARPSMQKRAKEQKRKEKAEAKRAVRDARRNAPDLPPESASSEDQSS